MPRLFVSWVDRCPSKPIEFGNTTLDYHDPSSDKDIKLLQLTIGNRLEKEVGGIHIVTILWFKLLTE